MAEKLFRSSMGEDLYFYDSEEDEYGVASEASAEEILAQPCVVEALEKAHVDSYNFAAKLVWTNLHHAKGALATHPGNRIDGDARIRRAYLEISDAIDRLAKTPPGEARKS